MRRVPPLISKRTHIVLETLGKMIKSSRLQRNMSQEMLAERLNVSRLTVRAIEKGNAHVSIGSVFEAAAIVNIPLFSEDEQTIKGTNEKLTQLTALLPKRGGRQKKELSDDF